MKTSFDDLVSQRRRESTEKKERDREKRMVPRTDLLQQSPLYLSLSSLCFLCVSVSALKENSALRHTDTGRVESRE